MIARSRGKPTPHPTHPHTLTLTPTPSILLHQVVTPEELYGFVHPATREWKDGVLSKVMRDLATDPDPCDKFIILDGDLDANWIESMNSVMGE